MQMTQLFLKTEYIFFFLAFSDLKRNLLTFKVARIGLLKSVQRCNLWNERY